MPRPDVSWAGPAPSLTTASSTAARASHKFTDQERSMWLDQITKTMSYHSAYDIGAIHRWLALSREPNTERALKKTLNAANADALAYVCIDIGRLPVGKYGKQDLIAQLVTWVSDYLLEFDTADIVNSSVQKCL